VTDRITAHNLYVDPPLGRVGMTEAEVRASRRPALMAKLSMDKVGRAFEKGDTRGFMKILVDGETGLILGASLLGIGADEVIHTLVDLMYAKAPYTVLKRAMHIHPTVSELLPTMMSQLEPLQ
jgi:pyruvate/2-oxoglutarate dehydrogenase complex dihydrolipoamide dehydrogenase (E3) component